MVHWDKKLNEPYTIRQEDLGFSKSITNAYSSVSFIGMRMAASQPDITTPSSSSKGMFAWMLPIYTVGVVAFLIYTLVKVTFYIMQITSSIICFLSIAILP